jgi:hypothetical protein
MTMTDSKRELIVEIDGFKIFSNSLYKVTHKKDNEAPSGFIQEGATKLPSAGIFNEVQCQYKVMDKASGKGVWDTGFYPSSPCYAGVNKEEVRRVVENLRKFIVVPYESHVGQDEVLHHSGDFWDTYMVTVKDGRVLNTADPNELLALYIMVRGRHVTPKGQEGVPKYKFAQYGIVDMDEAESVRDERANASMDANFEFMSMLKTNPTTLKSVLVYLGIAGATGTVSDKSLKSLFHDWLNAKTDRADEFMRILNMTKDDSQAEIIEIFTKVIDLVKKKVIQRTTEGRYYYDGEILGGDQKSVARNLATNPELEEIKIKLLEM